MKKWWISIAVALVLAAVFYLFARGGGTRVDVIVAQRLPIREYVDEQGKTRLPRTYPITMPFTARVGEITLEEGDRVQAGQVVARVVQEDVEAEFAEAKAAVERLEASIRETADATVERTTLQQAEYYVESMKSTVEAAKAQMTASRSRFEYATTYLNRIEQLQDSGARTEDDLDRAIVQKVEAEVDYQTDALTYQAILSVDAATRLLPSVISQYIARKELSVAVLREQKAEAAARLRTAELRLRRSQMTSPIDGVVLEKEITSEQQLSAGTLLLEIGQLEQLEVEAEILSQDATRIRQGDRAEIYGPSLGVEAGSGIAMVVDRIYPAGFTKVSSLGVEQQRVLVVLRFRPEDVPALLEKHSLGVEYRVQARIYTDEAADALVIPRSAIFRDVAGNWQALVAKNGVLQRRNVTVSLMNDLEVQITEGIGEGEQVLLSPEASLTEGDRVTAVGSRPAAAGA